MILGETQDLYHLMFGIAILIRLPLKVISLEETSKIRLPFYFMILGWICFCFWSKKSKDSPQSVHHVQPKSKEGLIVSRGATSITIRSILCKDVSNVFDVDLNTTNHEVTEHESHQTGIVDTSLIPSKESELPFNLEAPLPCNTQFQLDLLNMLS
jgi:hypothetical protein